MSLATLFIYTFAYNILLYLLVLRGYFAVIIS